jgi:hypothetical protein
MTSTDVRIVLTGYPASTEVNMAVYRVPQGAPSATRFDHVATLPTLSTDSRGEVATTWDFSTARSTSLRALANRLVGILHGCSADHRPASTQPSMTGRTDPGS